MNSKRLSQIKWYGLKRSDLEWQIWEINESILKDNQLKEIFQEFIVAKLTDDDFSLDYFNSIRYKMRKIKGIELSTGESLYKVLYSTLIHHLLLPNYIKWWQKEDIVKEFEKLFAASLKKLDKKIEQVLEWFYSVELGNLDELEDELEWRYSDDLYGVDFRSFAIGGPFWANIMWYSDDEKAYVFQIPVRLPIKMTTNDEDERETLDPKIVEKVMKKYFPKSLKDGKKWPAHSLWFDDFCIKTKKEQNKEWEYGIDAKNNYFVITLMNEKISDFDLDRHSIDTITTTLRSFLKINNFLINEIIKESGKTDFKKRIYTFSSGEIFNWDANDDKESISKETLNKFKKLLVKDDIKVYLSDVWWQEKAKQEIAKIITSIKNEEIMRSWWAKTTSWIIFEWPAGTGKTLLAKVIATEVDAEVYNIKLTDIQSSAYINEWANNVKELFSFLRHKAKKTSKKMVVILDELDALFKKREWRNQSAEDTKVVNTFLSEMSGFDDIHNIIFIGTTNLIESLDEAVIRSGRMSTRAKVDLPDIQARKQIFDIHIQKVSKIGIKASQSFRDVDRDILWEKTDHFSGADIAEVVRRIVEKKAIIEVNTGVIESISNDEILSIIEEIKKQKRKNIDLLWNFDTDLRNKLQDKNVWEYYRQAVIQILAEKLRSEFNTGMWKWNLDIVSLEKLLLIWDTKSIWFL